MHVPYNLLQFEEMTGCRGIAQKARGHDGASLSKQWVEPIIVSENDKKIIIVGKGGGCREKTVCSRLFLKEPVNEGGGIS